MSSTGFNMDHISIDQRLNAFFEVINENFQKNDVAICSKIRFTRISTFFLTPGGITF
jgi:hypothetical protein